MKKNNLLFLTAMLVVALLSVASGCDNRDDMRGSEDQKATLGVDKELVRLTDDSTGIAGIIGVSCNLQEIQLKWNVPSGCNIDTSFTKLSVHNGSCDISVRWLECTDSLSYGPQSKAFDVGVLVSAGDVSKYVHLVWADAVDSLTLMQRSAVQTRSDDVMPIAAVLTITPSDVLNMDIVAGGAMFVDFSGMAAVLVDQSNIMASTNIDKAQIPPLLRTPDVVFFKWAPEAPTFNFSTRVTYSGGGLMETVNINYLIPTEDAPVWEFISSSVATGGNIPSTNASVTVQVKTNKPWSLESPEGLVSPVQDFTTGIGVKDLVIHFTNNPTANSRTVTLIVKSQGVLKETLTFTQAANTGGGEDPGTAFTFISSTPVDQANIPATGVTLTVKVNTDYAWWIDLNGTKAPFPAGALGDKTGTIAIPANAGTTAKTITVTVGHGTTTVKTLTFTQPGNGGGGAEDDLVYSTSDLPTGNIPAAGKVYTFTFTGTFAGNFRMRAINATTNEVISNGPIGTTHTPKVTISANAGTATRNIKFQYKKTDITTSPWTDLPTTTNRIQDATGGGGGETGNVTPSQILPPGDIPEKGGTYACQFTGTGKVIFRARRVTNSSGVTDIAAISPEQTVPVRISLVVTPLPQYNSRVYFEYSTDGGTTWKVIESRIQKNEWAVVNPPNPLISTLPAKGAAVVFPTSGDYSKPIRFEVYTISPGSTYYDILLGKTEGYVSAGSITVPVPDNPNTTSRSIVISFTYDGSAWSPYFFTQVGK